jgi:hypothetical protein
MNKLLLYLSRSSVRVIFGFLFDIYLMIDLKTILYFFNIINLDPVEHPLQIWVRRLPIYSVLIPFQFRHQEHRFFQLVLNERIFLLVFSFPVLFIFLYIVSFSLYYFFMTQNRMIFMLVIIYVCFICFEDE